MASATTSISRSKFCHKARSAKASEVLHSTRRRRMRVIILGGTGELGTILSRAFHHAGQDVVAISRGAAQTPWRSVQWDATTHGPWCAELDGADVVINLAGRSVNCRYNDSNRQQIMQSRVVTTRLVGEAIAAASRPPRVWLQGEHGHHLCAPLRRPQRRSQRNHWRRPGRPRQLAFQHRRSPGVGARTGQCRRA